MPKTSAKDVTKKVDEVKNIMHDNIEKAADNCVKLETIETTSEELMQHAGVFQQTAKQLHLCAFEMRKGAHLPHR